MSDLGYYYGSAFRGGTSGSLTSLPPQAIPLKNKDEKWAKRTMDVFENVGKNQIQKNMKFNDIFRMIEGKMSYTELSEAIPKFRELQKVLDDVNIDTWVRHYDIIGIIINGLLGEYSTNGDKFFIATIDEVSTSEFAREYTDRMLEYLETFLQKDLQTKLALAGYDESLETIEFNSEEEKQQYLQEIEQKKAEMTPDEIKKDMSSNWRTMAAKWAEKKVEEDTINFDMDRMDLENLKDFLATGRAFRHYHIGYDYYKPEVWRMLNTFFSEDLDNKLVQEGDFVGRIHAFTRTQMVTRYSHLLSANMKKKILRSDSKNYDYSESFNFEDEDISYKKMFNSHFHRMQVVPFEGYNDYKFMLDVQNTMGIPMGEKMVMNRDGVFEKVPVPLSELNPTGDLGWFNNKNQLGHLRNDYSVRRDMLTVTEVYWKSFERIAYLSYITPEGSRNSTIVTEEILPDFLKENEIKSFNKLSLDDLENKDLEGNYIVWDYKPVSYQGKKASGIDIEGKDEAYYFDIKKCDIQIPGYHNPMDVLLPVAGILDEGLAYKLEPFQVMYNMVMNQLFNLLEKEIGIFYIFDVGFLPSEFKGWGNTEETLLYMKDLAKDVGLFPVEGSKANLQGGGAFNQFSAVDLSFSKQIADRMQTAEFIKNKAFEQVGYTQQRLGGPTKYETAEGVKISQDASYAQTEEYFSKFAYFKRRALELHLSVAQFCQKDGKDPQSMYTNSDGMQVYNELNDPHLPLRRWGITPQLNSKKRKELASFKEYIFNTNTLGADELAVAEMLTSESMTAAITTARKARLDRQEQEGVAHQRGLETIQAQTEATDQLEQKRWEREEYSKQKDREASIQREAIDALGRAADRNSDDDGFNRILEQTRLALDSAAQKAAISTKQIENTQKEKQADRDFLLKKEELSLKRADIATRNKVSNDNVAIARINPS